MENQLYKMTILEEKSKDFEKCLAEDYLDKITIKKEVAALPYIVYHLDTNDITRAELANLQDKFLF